MRHDPGYRKITIAAFLAVDFGADRRFELHDGIIRDDDRRHRQTGLSMPHAEIFARD